MTDDSRTRRRFLRAAGATVAVGALAGCGDRDRDGTTSGTTASRTAGTTSETTGGPGRTTGTGETAGTTSGRTGTTSGRAGTASDRRGTPRSSTTRRPGRTVDRSRYGTVVNVAEAGADPTGEEPVEAVLDDAVGDDTLLYFPPGRYRLTEWKATGYRNLGVVGEDATLVPPPSADYWLMWGDLRAFTFAGFTIDCRGDGVAPITSLAVTGGRNVVRDVTVRGHRRAPRTAFEIAAADPAATLLFDNVVLPDGSTDGHAVYVHPRSVGRLTFRDCRVEHWMEGLYAAYHSGPLRVLGGYYANNGIEQVRVGGGTSGALVRGVTVRVDDPRQPRHKPNMRGIWAEEGGRVRVEDCDVAITDLTGTYSSGAVVVGKQFGEVVLRNTRVRTDADVPAINVRDPIDSTAGKFMPSMDGLPERTRFTARNVRIEGTAGSGTAVRVHRRDDCRFEGLCVSHPNGSRDGLRVSDAEGCSVRDATIDVSGEAIRTEDATVTTERVRTDGSC